LKYLSYSAHGKIVFYDSSNAGSSKTEFELHHMEYGCCCDEFTLENIIQCRDHHQFCFGCV